MTKHIPDLDTTPLADQAARRDYVKKWIARQQRKLAAGLGGSVLMLPLLAQAQTVEMVDASTINGVTSVQVGADGSAQITLSNGQVVSVAAAEVTVTANGAVLISAAAAQVVAEVALAAGLGGLGTGALAGLGAGVAAAAAVGAGGGGGDDAPPPLPVLNAGAISGASPAAAATVFGAFPTLTPGDRVFVTIGDGGAEFAVTVAPDGTITFPPALDLSGVQGTQPISFRVERDVPVPVLDAEGEPVLDGNGDPTTILVPQDVATGSATVVIDTIAPVIAINDDIAGDDVINLAERSEALTVSGTTNAEDGQTVTVTFNGTDFTTTAQAGVWSVSIPATALTALADGAPVAISAAVSDVAGNAATPATATVATDFTAGLTLAPVVIETINTFIGVQVTGTTTGVETGRTVTVTFDGTDYTTTTGADGAWSVTIPAAVISALSDDATIAVSAAVSDVAGNPASATASSMTDFSTPALAITSPATGGFLNSTTAAQDLVVSGSAIDGSVVTVTLPGGVTETATANAGNTWTVTFAAADLPAAQGPLPINASTTLGGTVINAPTVTLTIDTLPPAIPTLALTEDTGTLAGTTSNGDVTVTGLEAGAAREFSTDGGATWTAFTGNTFTLTGDGAKSVQVRTTDAAGNGPVASAPLAFTLDTTAPAAMTVTLDNDTGTVAGVTSDPQVNVTGRADGVLAEFSLDGGATWTAFSGTGFSLSGPDGARNVIVRQTDGAGNISPSSAPLAFTLDTTVPATPVATLAQDTGTVAGETSNGQVTVTGLEAGSIREFSVDGGATFTAFTGTSFTLMTEGANSVIVRQTDGAGNTSPNSAALDFTLDTVAPTVAITSFGGIAANGTLTAANLLDGNNAALETLPLVGTTNAADGTVITVTIGTATVTTTANGGNWTANVPAATVTAQLGSVATTTIAAAATDGAGNTGTGNLPLTVDLAVPTIDLTAPAGGTVLGLAAFEGGLAVSGTTTDVPNGRTVTIELRDGAAVVATTTAIVANNAFAGGFTAAQVQGLGDQSSFTLGVSVTDGSFPIPATDSVAVTTNIPPQIEVNDPGIDGALVIADLGATVTISGTTRGVQAGQSVEIRDTADPTILYGTATVQANGTWTTNVPVPAGFSAGDVIASTTTVANASGRTASFAGRVVGYEAADFYVTGGTPITGGALEFAFFLDPRTVLPADGGLALGETMTFQTGVTTYVLTPAPNYIAGITRQVNTNNAATGEVVFGGIGFLDDRDAVPDPYAVPLIRFRMTHVDTSEVIVLVVDSQGGGTYDFVYGTDGVDTISAGIFDATLRGRGGDDRINVEAPGVNTVIFETTATANGKDTIIGFDLGNPLADRIGFHGLDNTTLRGDGSDFQVITAGSAIAANTGFVVISDNVDTDAEGLAALNGLGLQANDIVYILVGNDDASELVRIVVDGAGALPALDNIEVLAEFEGLDAAGRALFTADNILGFEQFNVT